MFLAVCTARYSNYYTQSNFNVDVIIIHYQRKHKITICESRLIFFLSRVSMWKNTNSKSKLYNLHRYSNAIYTSTSNVAISVVSSKNSVECYCFFRCRNGNDAERVSSTRFPIRNRKNIGMCEDVPSRLVAKSFAQTQICARASAGCVTIHCFRK